jgi:GNAT superfamily N-acetyltransferase
MTITIERAVAADVETLVKLQVLAFNDDARVYPGVQLGGPPGYDSVDATLKKIDEDDFYTIRYDGQIVGGLAVFDLGEGHFHLDVIFIDPAYHNRGIGTQAIHFIERTYPAQKWTLNTPDYATRNHHFYEKFGYVMVGKVALENIILRDYEKYL